METWIHWLLCSINYESSCHVLAIKYQKLHFVIFNSTKFANKCIIAVLFDTEIGVLHWVEFVYWVWYPRIVQMWMRGGTSIYKHWIHTTNAIIQVLPTKFNGASKGLYRKKTNHIQLFDYTINDVSRKKNTVFNTTDFFPYPPTKMIAKFFDTLVDTLYVNSLEKYLNTFLKSFYWLYVILFLSLSLHTYLDIHLQEAGISVPHCCGNPKSANLSGKYVETF